MVFQDGVPQRLSVHDFLTHYGANFPRLLREENKGIVEKALSASYTMFAGVGTLWSHLDKELWYEKTRLCYGFITAWYITDVYPSFAAGIASMGGVPVKTKNIGGVKITYDTTGVISDDALKSLRTNTFGNKAYQMIKSSGSLLKIFGRSR